MCIIQKGKYRCKFNHIINFIKISGLTIHRNRFCLIICRNRVVCRNRGHGVQGASRALYGWSNSRQSPVYTCPLCDYTGTCSLSNKTTLLLGRRARISLIMHSIILDNASKVVTKVLAIKHPVQVHRAS